MRVPDDRSVAQRALLLRVHTGRHRRDHRRVARAALALGRALERELHLDDPA
ncbi:MAG: hypothetical protein IT383_04385 [Deltaproteobacteria bacterium]|nr:hypothetical protein [Deltaproteobacteria bacterium]